MAALEHAATTSRASITRWVIRFVVLGAFAATVWWAGPRAVSVLAARLDRAAQDSPPVVLDRVGFVHRPEWVDDALLVAITQDLGPWLQDEVPILDENAGRRLLDGVRSVPWVRDAGLERVFPDRFRIRLDLRRPVLAVVGADGTRLCLVDRSAVALPWVDTPLPTTWLHQDGGWPTTLASEPGKPVDDPRVRAAAAIAVEFRDEFAPLVPNCPALLEVDATNLDERWMRGRGYPEIRITLRREDGAGVVFAYDHPVDSRWPRLPVGTKATVLGKILGEFPGLRGLVGGDLRFVIRWRDYLLPRAPGIADPDGQWASLGGDAPRK